ncbi:hypothetical protein RHSIM_Rhsim04G0048000 [Rhododendron simsii]|uniref:Uncharacterized protein n=1 Tax=Rhododendron simsii TaxID=118357 RepID=A0A834LSP8_RHOSS|nr:hypothetical protein RHSIM_Rhsim04G0048000 [Rhododendron simsii]
MCPSKRFEFDKGGCKLVLGHHRKIGTKEGNEKPIREGNNKGNNQMFTFFVDNLPEDVSQRWVRFFRLINHLSLFQGGCRTGMAKVTNAYDLPASFEIQLCSFLFGILPLAFAFGCSLLGGKTSGFIYCGLSAAGVFNLSDACRSGAKEEIEELKLLGVRTAMLTGDCLAAAVLVQDQLEDALDQVRAELLPQDKATIIQDLKNKGTVALIGDGMNDAPALATTDIGISMGIAGLALATETGDMHD